MSAAEIHPNETAGTHRAPWYEVPRPLLVSARVMRLRLGWRLLTDEERDEQLSRNLDDVCPTASMEPGE